MISLHFILTHSLKSYSMELFIEENTSVFFFLKVRCSRSFDTVPFYCNYIQLGVFGNGSILILLIDTSGHAGY
jgi:hypothetical protein